MPGLNANSIYSGNHEATILCNNEEVDTSVFTPQELATLEEINAKLGSLSTSEIVELSHREAAWINNYPNRGIIPYCDAFQILL